MNRDIPKVYQNNYQKAMRGRSHAAAIKACCLECVSYQREEVRLCVDSGCPLWPYRPFQDSKKGSS